MYMKLKIGIIDLRNVYRAVYPCHHNWYKLCLDLGVSDCDLSAIDLGPGETDTKLRKGLGIWLKGIYSYGQPTWSVLVNAVANSSGGNNQELALKIADQHKST